MPIRSFDMSVLKRTQSRKKTPEERAKVALGWRTAEFPDGDVIANPNFHVHVLRAMNVDDKGDFLYDQILRMEAGGGLFLPVKIAGGEVYFGLQNASRPQARSMKEYKELFARGELRKIIDTLLGRECWEAPRGFAKSVTESGKDAALREAREETQSMVVSAMSLGEVCDNTAFVSHLTEIQCGLIDSSRKPADKEDPNEKLLSKVRWFTQSELITLMNEGKLYCGFTLAAIGMYLLRNVRIAVKK